VAGRQSEIGAGSRPIICESTKFVVTLPAFALPPLGDFHLPSYPGHIGFSNLKTMREVISVHVGQAGVQIGNACCKLADSFARETFFDRE
jgi:hypothetical protein